MTDTTSLGFIYPEDDDYPDTKADVPRAVQELAESVDNFLAVGTSLTLASLGFENGWEADVTPIYYQDPFDRVYLGGSVTNGSLGVPVVTFPAGYRPSADVNIVVYFSTAAFATVRISSNGELTIRGSGLTDPATGQVVFLDGVSWRATA